MSDKTVYDSRINITISVHDGQFFTNASAPDGSFVCTPGQHTLDLSIASAMPEIRSYAERLFGESQEKQRLFDLRQASGLCVACGARPPLPGDWECIECNPPLRGEGEEEYADIVTFHITPDSPEDELDELIRVLSAI